MAYTPNTWKSGDVVTSNKLNNIEQGIAASGVLFAAYDVTDPDAGTCDKTFAEISAAITAGAYVVATVELEEGYTDYLQLRMASAESIMFETVEVGENTVTQMAIYHPDEGNILWHETQFTKS